MAELAPATAAALDETRALIFGAVSIALPGGTVRLLDGAAEVFIGGHKYAGRDGDWGVLDSISGLAEAVDDNSPVVTLSMIPSGDLALSTMLDPANQGSEVQIMIGVLNMATGALIGEPYVLFHGEMDVPTVQFRANDRRVSLRVSSWAERLFALEEGRRLSAPFHKSIWAGELGLDFVTGVEVPVPWGQEANTSSVQVRSNLPGFSSTYSRT